MTTPYDTIRAVKARLLELAKEARKVDDPPIVRLVVELVRLVVDLARECETLAHWVSNLQDRLAGRRPGVVVDHIDDAPTAPIRVK